jgi:drug/metabolite transporter (DMT)-like permease
MTDDLSAALFALAAAAGFGASVHAQRRGLAGMDAAAGALIGAGVATLIFACAAPFVVDPAWILSEATAWFALCGLFMPALSMILAIRSVGIAGPALTAALGSCTPLFAITPAILLLGEEIGPRTALGIAVMTSGLALAPFVQTGAASLRVPLWALALPLGAAALRGVSQPIAKFGMLTAPSPVYAALVTFSVSTVLLALFNARKLPRILRGGPSAAWFVAAGAINGVSMLCLNSALRSGEVVVAAPLAATAPLWALVWGALVFRSERLTLRHLGVAALATAGAALIVSR